jgi:hypothetical protein
VTINNALPLNDEAAERMKSALARTGGVLQAAYIIEEVVRTGKPVAAEPGQS